MKKNYTYVKYNELPQQCYKTLLYRFVYLNMETVIQQDNKPEGNIKVHEGVVYIKIDGIYIKVTPPTHPQ